MEVLTSDVSTVLQARFSRNSGISTQDSILTLLKAKAKKSSKHFAFSFCTRVSQWRQLCLLHHRKTVLSRKQNNRLVSARNSSKKRFPLQRKMHANFIFIHFLS